MGILTTEQAADYLQLNRETIYHCIRDGKLAASRLGYRVPHGASICGWRPTAPARTSRFASIPIGNRQIFLKSTSSTTRHNR